MKEEKNDQIKGYIVKLYKKMVNAPKKATIGDAMFMTWMNFDCMDVTEISEFREFNKSLVPSRMEEREKYESRQKLFLYSWEKGSECLLKKEELKEFPLITLTVLDLRRQPDMDGPTCKNILKENIGYCIKGKDDVKGEICGSLSIYEYVLVLRGNRYETLTQVIEDYQNHLKKRGLLNNRGYTIAGLDLQYLSFWKEDPNLVVSVRLSCSLQITRLYLENNAKIKEALKEGYEVFPLIGKYDYDIIGQIKNTQKFAGLFLNQGALSPAMPDIYKTNTRFMNTEMFAEDGAVSDLEDRILSGSLNSEDEKLDDYIERYMGLTGLCPSIRESLLRLLLRLFQAKTTTGNSRIKNSLKVILEYFFDFLRLHQNEAESQDEFGQMINCLNLFLDNRLTASMSDFETPQNVLRYSGASLRVLLAYSDFVEKLFSILQFYKVRSEQGLRYVPLVTTDTGAKITATVYLSYCNVYRFININMPVDLLFEVQDALPWLTHEVGHFIRAGWKRYERNDAYFLSVSRVIVRKLEPYANTDIVQDGGEFPGIGSMAEGYEGQKFDSYRERVCQFYQNIVDRCVYEYNKKIQIPYNHARKLSDLIQEVTDNLQKIYEESIADIYMIQVLQINSLTEYLHIQSAYYQHINLEKEKLPIANISRVMAVSVVIEGLEPKDYKGIKEHFRSFYHKCRQDEILSIAKQLSEYKKYYMIEPLVCFLIQKVGAGLKELLREDKMSNICEDLQRSYKKLRGGKFTAFFEFIEEDDS